MNKLEVTLVGLDQRHADEYETILQKWGYKPVQLKSKSELRYATKTGLVYIRPYGWTYHNKKLDTFAYGSTPHMLDGFLGKLPAKGIWARLFE